MIEISTLVNLKKLTISALIGYIISWTYFFVTLPIFQKLFGIVKGGFINYMISWILLLLVIFLLGVIYPNIDGEVEN